MKNRILFLIPIESDTKPKFLNLAETHNCDIDFDDIDNISNIDLSKYSIIIGCPPTDRLHEAANLKYLHLSMAGSNNYVKEGILPSGVLLTNSTGAFGHAISEHMMGMLFEIYKKLHLYRDNQNKNMWHGEGKVKSIRGASCLVLGMGDIGSEFAKTANAVGIKVSGIRRTTTEKPYYIEKMYRPDELNDIIGNFDIIAMALPETPDTINIINETNISKMKKGAVIINAGRGSAIDTDALYKALESGHLGGAGLDVTRPEPLPADHPLWQCKNAVITPHISGFYNLRETYDNIVKLAYTNLEAYLCNKKPQNIVDFKTGYRIPNNQ